MKNIFLKLGISFGVMAILIFPFIALAEEKVTICHATSSAENPYVEILISVNALDSHLENHGDFIIGEGGECGIVVPD